jgi:hypothetical protein
MKDVFFTNLNTRTNSLYKTTIHLLYSFHLKHYFEFLNSNIAVITIFQALNTKYPKSLNQAQDLFQFPYATEDHSYSKINYTREGFIEEYEKWVCLCYNYLSLFQTKSASLNNLLGFITPLQSNEEGLEQYSFALNTINGKTDSELVALILNEFIEPIKNFIELKISKSIDYLLLRYKIFCEFYDKPIFSDEKEITERHLPLFLFHEGVDINLAEAQLPSYDPHKKHLRIDDFFIYKGNNYLAESKLFKEDSNFKTQPIITLETQLIERLQIIGHK